MTGSNEETAQSLSLRAREIGGGRPAISPYAQRANVCGWLIVQSQRSHDFMHKITCISIKAIQKRLS